MTSVEIRQSSAELWRKIAPRLYTHFTDVKVMQNVGQIRKDRPINGARTA